VLHRQVGDVRAPDLILTLAFFYNVVALAAAAAGRLHPLLAATAMLGSSLTVIGNSFRLRHLALDGTAPAERADHSPEEQRAGKHLTVKVKLGERPSTPGVGADLAKPPPRGTLRGIGTQGLTPDLREQLGLPADTQGVVITSLDPTSPAAQAGLRQGGVIEAVDRQPVRSVTDFERLAAQAKGDALLRINRQGSGAHVVVSPTETGRGNDQ
jgi:membrane-associated protease RseP (regulator of RpoE activity)